MSVTSKSFATVPGATSIVPIGIYSSNVLIVTRSGKVHERVGFFTDLESGSLRWAWYLSRIRFPSDRPFEAGEKVEVLYKY